jgi:hypothetical protein
MMKLRPNFVQEVINRTILSSEFVVCLTVWAWNSVSRCREEQRLIGNHLIMEHWFLSGSRCSSVSRTQCLTTDWTNGWSGFYPRQKQEDFSCSLCDQTGSGAHPASDGNRGSFPGGKARSDRDDDHSSHLLPGQEWVGAITSPPTWGAINMFSS